MEETLIVIAYIHQVKRLPGPSEHIAPALEHEKDEKSLTQAG